MKRSVVILINQSHLMSLLKQLKLLVILHHFLFQEVVSQSYQLLIFQVNLQHMFLPQLNQLVTLSKSMNN